MLNHLFFITVKCFYFLFPLPLTILCFITETEELNNKSIEFTDLKKFMQTIFQMNDVSWFLPDYMFEVQVVPDPLDATIQLEEQDSARSVHCKKYVSTFLTLMLC
jgi:hypothetical protein